ncbi:MAG: hypothetical protein AAGH65_08765 [Pseudomonadota bacterium]
MSTASPLSVASDPLLFKLNAWLATLQANRQTSSYLQTADAIAVSGPHRIGQLTALLEHTMAVDHTNGQPLRAAMVVSRTQSELPAPGFFMHAQALGAQSALCSNETFHQHCLNDLFKNLPD